MVRPFAFRELLADFDNEVEKLIAIRDQAKLQADYAYNWRIERINETPGLSDVAIAVFKDWLVDERDRAVSDAELACKNAVGQLRSGFLQRWEEVENSA